MDAQLDPFSGTHASQVIPSYHHLAQMVPRATSRTLVLWVIRNTTMRLMPAEILDLIYSLINKTPVQQLVPLPTAAEDEPKGPRGDPSKPPADGTTPFMRLPTELRNKIYAALLLSKHKVIKPHCDHDSRWSKVKGLAPRRNATSDLMVLNKKIKEEIALLVYQERTFEIHVHEGINGGGIEFLDAGRQPVQYLSDDCGIDTRFTRFSGGDEFGFSRLKKIKIVIYSKTDSQQERHTAMNTYFMNLALAQMLQRGSEKDDDRITSLTILFESKPLPQSQDASNRHTIMQGENKCHWWDANKQEPLSTEIHQMSDIRLILHPFSLLRKVHNVNIQLPVKLLKHADTRDFVKDLKQTIMSTSTSAHLMHDGTLEMKANAIKYDLYENHIYRDMFGHSGQDIGALTEKDMQDDGEHDEGSPKHALSPVPGGDVKRHKRFDEDADFIPIDSDDDDEDSIVWNLARMEKEEKAKVEAMLPKSTKKASRVADFFQERAKQHQASIAENTGNWAREEAERHNRERVSQLLASSSAEDTGSWAREEAERHNREQVSQLFARSSARFAPLDGYSLSVEGERTDNFAGTGFSLQSLPAAPRQFTRSQRRLINGDSHPGYAASSPQIGGLRLSSSGLSDMVQLPPQDTSTDAQVRCPTCNTPLPDAKTFLSHRSQCSGS